MQAVETMNTSSLTPEVQKILANYESDNDATKANLARLLMQGRLGGTGKMVILPVDQGFEHGPARSFAKNPAAYDPHYHYQMAVDAGLNAYAAPLGMLEAGAETFKGQIPTILKVNSSNSITPGSAYPDQAVTSTVEDAVRLGCSAIGYTIYPGGHKTFDMLEELRELAREAKDAGLAVVVWSYVRGEGVDKSKETAIDAIAYAAHMAALMGAHIIKVKPPVNDFAQAEAQKAYEENGVKIDTLADRIAHVKQCAFNNRRIVIFSGGAAKGTDAVLEEISQINQGGGNGSIIGRNCFQRPRDEALDLLDKVINIYLG